MTAKTLKKIQGLAKVANLPPDKINNLLGDLLEDNLDDMILEHTKNFLRDLGITSIPDRAVAEKAPDPVGRQDHTGSLGVSIEDFEKMDEALASSDESPYKEPEISPVKGEEVEEEEDDEDDNLFFDEEEDNTAQDEPENREEDMATKNRFNQDVEYQDDIMREAQEMAESGGEFELPSSVAADAASSFLDGDEDDDLEGGATEDGFIPKKERSQPKGSGFERNDASTGEDGYVPDVLPVDFGINKIAGDGSDKDSVDFFTRLMMGQEGDRSRRG